jgi:hypothetical protein
MPILIPVNATGHGGQKQLDIISMSNVGNQPINAWRFFAHASCAWLFFGKSTFFINHTNLLVPGKANLELSTKRPD